jgi:hypothetical protein
MDFLCKRLRECEGRNTAVVRSKISSVLHQQGKAVRAAALKRDECSKIVRAAVECGKRGRDERHPVGSCNGGSATCVSC